MITDKDRLVEFYSSFVRLEKKLFGGDFEYDNENITQWFDSKYSLICIKQGSESRPIQAYGSLIVISRSCYEKLVQGIITEEELQPISVPSNSDVAYFASIYSCVPHGAQEIVNTMKAQLANLVQEEGLELEIIFSIASTSRGLKFIENQGWSKTAYYLEKYPILQYPLHSWLSEKVLPNRLETSF
ncbi:hypothetical protein OPW41_10415 [Vibrio europaeus]|uniref:hypothetical protein n=1 Tax=Vibrio europaeus TaxID=300876 RepID=UPI00233F5315|nr:hypothetical protein [Vibrio europaeus]MDC5720807.1 hypothetical protein [Vibrio europaeus]MDC5755525.1 hypothetical protein [Vibrio europaeus]MDC5776104.1 hypothetical protein [Vibrio europaeus]MDC5795242.1 hypothetical protein [Vibrio europaeus]MDC5799813.1 hypothetical protein [Vibrio europaeus]